MYVRKALLKFTTFCSLNILVTTTHGCRHIKALLKLFHIIFIAHRYYYHNLLASYPFSHMIQLYWPNENTKKYFQNLLIRYMRFKHICKRIIKNSYRHYHFYTQHSLLLDDYTKIKGNWMQIYHISVTSEIIDIN